MDSGRPTTGMIKSIYMPEAAPRPHDDVDDFARTEILRSSDLGPRIMDDEEYQRRDASQQSSRGMMRTLGELFSTNTHKRQYTPDDDSGDEIVIQESLNKSQSRVVLGTEAREGEYPFIATLYFPVMSRSRRNHLFGRQQLSGRLMKEESDDDSFLLNNKQDVVEHACGGTLIAPRWVLSAAHCFCTGRFSEDLTFTRVVLGEHDLRAKGESEQWIRVHRIFIHDRWFLSRFSSGDISLVLLAEDATLSNNVQIIPLPDSPSTIHTGAITVAGWGNLYFTAGTGPARPCILNSVMQAIVPIDECKLRYDFGQQELPEEDRQELVQTDGSHLCAGRNSMGDSCNGDSGGPATCIDPNGQPYLCGVVNFGFQCNHPFFPGVYANVTFFLPWIRQVMGSELQEPVCNPEQKVEVHARYNCLVDGNTTRVQGSLEDPQSQQTSQNTLTPEPFYPVSENEEFQQALQNLQQP